MPTPKRKTRAPDGQTTIRGLKADPQHPWRHENTGRLLLTSVINWQDVLVRGLQMKGFRAFRASHMNVLRHGVLGDPRPAEIADRSRMSKQAVGQLIAICETQKLVKTVSDATDRRAKIVTFTERGRAVIDAEREVMERMDADLQALLGMKGFGDLRHSLMLLSEWTGPFASEKPPSPARRRSGKRSVQRSA